MWPLLASILPGILDKILPDEKAASDAKLKVLELAQQGEFKQMDSAMQIALAQADINKAEAATDTFRGGWRPACGWVCAFGLGYTFLLRPLLPWFVTVSGHTVPPLPEIDTETLMVLLTGMLGLGGLRTFERVKGKA